MNINRAEENFLQFNFHLAVGKYELKKKAKKFKLFKLFQEKVFLYFSFLQRLWEDFNSEMKPN